MTVQHLTSRDNPLLAKLRKLVHDPLAYRKLGEVWLEGEHLCEACLARGVIPRQAIVTEEAWALPRWRGLAERSPRVAVVPSALFKGVSGLESPAQIGFVLGWDPAAALRGSARTVILDRLQDAGNVGTVLRSAAAFGIEQVIALKGTAGLWSPKVLRSAMGAHFSLHLVEGAEEGALDNLGVPLIATSSHATESIAGTRLPDPCAWLLGHEGQGVAPNLLARASQTLSIPQPGGEESLNVAVAASICFYEAMRQRLPAAG